MIDSRVFLNMPLPFGDICSIYPPTVREVVGNDNILYWYSLLTYSQEMLEYLLKQKQQAIETKIPTPLEFLLINAYHTPEFKEQLIQAFKQFTHSTPCFVFEQKMIILTNCGDNVDLTKIRALTEENFLDFQNQVRIAMGDEIVKPIPKDESEFQKKIRINAFRREQSSKKYAKKGTSFTTTLAAICCMNFGLNPLNIGEISYASINALTTTYQQKEKYQIDIDSIMAGGDPKKIKPKYWIREDSGMAEVTI